MSLVLGDKPSMAMVLLGRGFAPHGNYLIRYKYPTGKVEVKRGVATVDGVVLHMWTSYRDDPEKREPAGKYRVMLKDLTTGRIIKKTFVVDYSKGK